MVWRIDSGIKSPGVARGEVEALEADIPELCPLIGCASALERPSAGVKLLRHIFISGLLRVVDIEHLAPNTD